MQNKRTFLPYMAAIITSSIFGLSFLFSKMALNLIDPFTLLSYRFLLAFIVMNILVISRIDKLGNFLAYNFKNKPLKEIFLLALMQPIAYFTFETYGIKYSSSSQAGLMIALIPIAVTLLGAYKLKEKVPLLQWIFILISVGGVVLIVIMNSSSSSSFNALGTILLLGAVMSAAIFCIISRKLSKYFSAFFLTYFMMGTGALFFSLMSLVIHIKDGSMSVYILLLKNTSFLYSIIYLGILSSIVAFFLNNYTLSKIEASKSSVFANISTIVSILAGVLILKENFKYYHFIGSFLIIFGVWGTNSTKSS